MGIKLDIMHMRKIAGLLNENDDVAGLEMDMGDEGADDAEMGADAEMGGDEHVAGEQDMEGHVEQEGHVFERAVACLEEAKEYLHTELESCEQEDPRCEEYHKMLGAIEHLAGMFQEHLAHDEEAGEEGMGEEGMDDEMGGEEDMGEEGGEEMPAEEAPMGESLKHVAGGKKTSTKVGSFPVKGKGSKAFKKAGSKKMKHQM